MYTDIFAVYPCYYQFVLHLTLPPTKLSSDSRYRVYVLGVIAFHVVKYYTRFILNRQIKRTVIMYACSSIVIRIK